MQKLRPQKSVRVQTSYASARKAVGAILIVVGLVTLLLVAVVARGDDLRVAAVSKWTVTQGGITKVLNTQSWRLPNMLSVTYEYSVGGRRYVNDRIRVGNNLTSDYSTYFAGKKVLVHFNPSIPSQAYLEAATNNDDRFSGFALGASLIVIGLIFLYLGFCKPSLRL